MKQKIKSIRLSALAGLGLIFLMFGDISVSAEDKRQKVDLSRYVPADVLERLNSVSSDDRKRICQGIVGNRYYLLSAPNDKISGLTSQMKNVARQVIGKLDNMSHEISSVAWASYVRDDEYQKTFLIKLLSLWAKKKAYLNTVNCKSVEDCGGAWKSQRGTELAPLKDYQSALERILPIGTIYYLFLFDFKRDEYREEHKLIENWLEQWYARIWPEQWSVNSHIDVGFGLNWNLWATSLHELANGDEKSFQMRLKKIDQKIGYQIQDDGSIKERTTRGSRATWYHYQSLGEIFVALEMLKANGLDKYPLLEQKLHKAVTIFLDAVDDINEGRNLDRNPARIYRWAKQDFHSAGDPRIQDFADYQIYEFSSWLYIYMYRFPNHENSKRMRSLISRINMFNNGDSLSGLSTSCLYRIMDNEYFELERKRPLISEETLKDFITHVDEIR